MKQPKHIQAKWNNLKHHQKTRTADNNRYQPRHNLQHFVTQLKHLIMSWNDKNQDKLWNDITRSKQVQTSENNQRQP